MAKKLIRCSIVGLGRIGSTLEDDQLREKPATHAGAIRFNPECKLVAGCDIDSAKRIRFSKRWDCKAVFKDCSEMLKCTQPDILHIATPPETHAGLIKTAINHQVPLVICEKPLTYSADEAKEIIERCSAVKTILMVNHERRYSLDYIHTHGIIEEKKYGELLSISAKLYMGRNKKIKDLLWDDSTHLIDIILYLLNEEATGIQSFGDPESRKKPLIILFKAGDVQVILEISSGHDAVVFELDLSFTHGRIRIGNGLYEEYKSSPSPYYEGLNSLRRLPVIYFKKTEYFSGMLGDAVEVLRNPSKIPRSSGCEACKSVEIIEKILRNLH